MARGRKTETQTLKDEIQALKLAKKKLQSKVAELEAKLDAKDLEGGDGSSSSGSEDGADGGTMKKMLDTFRDLMEKTTLGEDEECSICMETMELNEAASLPCDHIYCTTCLFELAKTATLSDDNFDEGEEGDERPKFPCPECRSRTAPEDTAVVTLKETDRFNALLELSVKYAKFAQSREDDEEDAEDTEAHTSDAGGDGAQGSEDGDGDGDEEEFVSRASRYSKRRALSASQSEEDASDQRRSPEKRRKMEQLVASRSRKHR